MPLGISYDQRAAMQPLLFTFANMGPKWTFGWIRYLEEVPVDALGIAPASRVEVIMPSGSREVYAWPDAYGTYPTHWSSSAVLRRVSTSPIRYERRLISDTIEGYGQADNAPAAASS